MDDSSARLHAFELLLDSSRFATEPTVELNGLRRLCARGIPPNPPHLRPLSYSLLLGSASPHKRNWKKETRERRQKYYDLVRTITADPALQAEVQIGSTTNDSPDTLLLAIGKDVKATSRKHRFLGRKAESAGRSNPLSAHKRTAKHESGLSSSSDSEDEQTAAATVEEGQARTEVRTSRLNTRTKRSEEPIPTRRVLASRLESMETWEHRLRAARSKQNSLDSVSMHHSGPSRKISNDVITEEPVVHNPAIVLSPTSNDGEDVKTTQNMARLRQSETSRPVSPSISLTTAYNKEDDTPDPMSDSITLLKSQELRPPTPAIMQDLTAEIELAKPDTHAECLVRMLFVFFRSHKEWTYSSSVVEVVRALYTVFASGGEIEALDDASIIAEKAGKGRRSENQGIQENEIVLNGWARHAEAETFWGLVALMGEMGEAVSGTREVVKDLTKKEPQFWSKKLARRLLWADEGLYGVLADRHLSPVTTDIYQHWLSTCFAGAFPIIYLLPILDFILAESPASPDINPKMETVVDVCTAMLILIRHELIEAPSVNEKSRNDMWGSQVAEEVVFDMRDAYRPEHERKLMASRDTELIRQYPIEHVGVKEVLRVTWEIRQQRLLAEMEGLDFDDFDVTPDIQSEPDDALADKLSALVAMAGHNMADRWAFKQVPVPTLPKAPNVRHSLHSGEKLFRQYAANVMDSDAAANLSRTSTNISAKAKARWSNPVPSVGQAAFKDESMSNGGSIWGEKASSLWGNVASAARQAAGTVSSTVTSATSDAPDKEDTLTALPPRLNTPARAFPDGEGAGLSRRDTNLPPSHFISPRGSIVYPAGRYRPKASQNDHKPSLQSRLAAAASEVPAAHIPAEKERTGMRPLILSASARPSVSIRPSSPAQSQRTASINSAISDRGSPSGSGSPGGLINTLDIAYYIPRKISLRRPQTEGGVSVASIGAARNGLARRGNESSSARLRSVTTGVGLGRPAMGRTTSRPSSGDFDESAVISNQRYALADPGTSRPQSPEEGSPGPTEALRYQLSDAPVEAKAEVNESKEELSVTALDAAGSAAGITRRGKVSVRPVGLRLRTAQSKEELKGATGSEGMKRSDAKFDLSGDNQ